MFSKTRVQKTQGGDTSDQALIRGAKILGLMGLELIENEELFNEIIEEHTHIKGHVK